MRETWLGERLQHFIMDRNGFDRYNYIVLQLYYAVYFYLFISRKQAQHIIQSKLRLNKAWRPSG